MQEACVFAPNWFYVGSYVNGIVNNAHTVSKLTILSVGI